VRGAPATLPRYRRLISNGMSPRWARTLLVRPSASPHPPRHLILMPRPSAFRTLFVLAHVLVACLLCSRTSPSLSFYLQLWWHCPGFGLCLGTLRAAQGCSGRLRACLGLHRHGSELLTSQLLIITRSAHGSSWWLGALITAILGQVCLSRSVLTGFLAFVASHQLHATPTDGT
jgi:hypothetical protein